MKLTKAQRKKAYKYVLDRLLQHQKRGENSLGVCILLNDYCEGILELPTPTDFYINIHKYFPEFHTQKPKRAEISGIWWTGTRVLNSRIKAVNKAILQLSPKATADVD